MSKSAMFFLVGVLQGYQQGSHSSQPHASTGCNVTELLYIYIYICTYTDALHVEREGREETESVE